MVRSCARPGCAEPAAATLSYDYDSRRVWLESLDPESHPMHYDQCERHAERLAVPVGWTLEDRRRRFPHRLAS